MSFFKEHPLRRVLSDEVHARPPVSLSAPEHVTYLAFLHDQNGHAQEVAHLAQLAGQLGMPEPADEAAHFFLDAGEFRLKWEKHNEFSSYTFFCRDSSIDGEQVSDPLLAVPTGWRKAIPGELVIATKIELRSTADQTPDEILVRHISPDTSVIASKVAGGAGWVFTDFQITDNYSHFLLLDESMTPRQAGRTVQRLLEIETYRVIALLAFPVAKQVATFLQRAEDELADIMASMSQADSSDDEGKVLTRLTQLATDIEHSISTTAFRFGAATAYYRLVQQRLDDLREIRISGYSPIREFMERRLTPAINTCTTIAQRQEDLSNRVARSSQLLRTRVDIALERQNQQQLKQMNRRAKQQLHLQQTVEGLSVVAITYYASQLVHYLAKGSHDLIAPATPELITAIAIPFIALIVAISLRRTRKYIERSDP